MLAISRDALGIRGIIVSGYETVGDLCSAGGNDEIANIQRLHSRRPRSATVKLRIAVPLHQVQVVVRGDTLWHDTCAHEELNQSGLHLGLPGLEVLTSHEHVVLIGEIGDIGNESVLRESHLI